MNDAQRKLLDEYMQEALNRAIADTQGEDAKELNDLIFGDDENRLAMLKVWAAKERSRLEQVVVDQETRLTRERASRDEKVPVLRQIERLDSL